MGTLAQSPRSALLLLAAGSSLLLALAGDDFAQHNHTVAIHECNTRQALAILEGVAHQWLLRREAALSHLVGLQGVGIVHLFSTSLLAHLPLELRDAASGPSAPHETDG